MYSGVEVFCTALMSSVIGMIIGCFITDKMWERSFKMIQESWEDEWNRELAKIKEKAGA